MLYSPVSPHRLLQGGSLHKKVSMKVKNIYTVLFVALILTSCGTAVPVVPPAEAAVSTSTSTPVPLGNTQKSPSPTASVRSYPPCAPSYLSFPPISKPWMQFDLSNGLILKEFHGPAEFDEQESGCRYADRDRARLTDITLDNSFRIITKPISDLQEEVVVLRNGEQVFETQIGRYAHSGLLEVWGYDDHWVIEFVTANSEITSDGIPPGSENIDIVRDGASLKQENSYKEVFAFQLLAGKPFYFFKKQDNTFGVNYDGHEIELDYDEIDYLNPRPELDKSIIQYENMVIFNPKKDGSWSYIEIGVFPEPAVPLPTFSPVRSTAAIAPTPVPETVVPTSKPTGTLSAEGPWLVYLHNSPSLGFADLGPIPAEFVLLNQDGSGRTLITLPECYDQVDAFLMKGGSSVNYMLPYDGGLYLFRPSAATGLLVYRQLWYSVCNTFFTGDEKGGLLASTYQAEDSAVPELIIYELPNGKIRDRFPLVRCAENANVCNQYRSNWSDMGRQKPQWSPNGRYLAFAAVLDAASSDLFVYDAQDGSLRRLTSGPDWVGPIEWSPDGTQIIMQELLNDGVFFFAPSSKPPSSVWSVSVSTNEFKLLYSTQNAYTEQNILRWLDDKRFITYEGYLVNAESARNLRFVDMEAGTDKILFDGPFVEARFDSIHETFALYTLVTEKYQQGWYLVSVKNATVHRLDETPFISNFVDWDPVTQLFVSEDDCQNNPQSFQAFNYQGNFSCVPKPVPTPDPLEPPSYPAPDGKSIVSVKDGLWLETHGSTPALLSQRIPSDVIWCPDSSCIFYALFQPDKEAWTLYRVSLPDQTIEIVDEGIKSTGSYQWLGVEK